MKTDHNMDQDQPTSPAASSFKTRLAVNFFQSMKKLNEATPTNYSQSMADRRKRCHVIKTAAYSSMAFSIGPKRAWARALLGKIKNRTLHHYLTTKSRTARRIRIIRRRNPRKGILGISQEDELRGLVPGGEGMDFCRLLMETAHYVMTLKAQIQVMENIVDGCSVID